MTAPLLTTDRLTLRRPDSRDETAMARFFSDARSRFYGGPKDAEQAWREGDDADHAGVVAPRYRRGGGRERAHRASTIAQGPTSFLP